MLLALGTSLTTIIKLPMFIIMICIGNRLFWDPPLIVLIRDSL